MGIVKSRSKERMTRVNRTMKTDMAAFSKSVNCTSQGRNSTLHPGLLVVAATSGGLKRNVCHVLDCMFYKCQQNKHES
jgi:hypothetical protein